MKPWWGVELGEAELGGGHGPGVRRRREVGEDMTDIGQLARGQEKTNQGCRDHTEAGTPGGDDFRLEGLSGNPGLSLDILSTCLTGRVGWGGGWGVRGEL